jgi:hypothetical protein
LLCYVLSLNRWGFPLRCPARHLQIYHKYKGQGVPFPPDFCEMLPRYRYPTTGVSLAARGYHTSRRDKRRGSQKQGNPPVDGDASRPTTLSQENQDVLKTLREMKLGTHIDHVHSIFVRRQKITLWLWSTGSTSCCLRRARFGPIPETFCTSFWQCHAWRFPPFDLMTLASSVRAPHVLLITQSSRVCYCPRADNLADNSILY